MSILKIIAPPDEQSSILEILQSVIDNTKGLPGCMGCFHYEQEGEGAVIYLEQWETKDDLYRHIQSDLYQRLISVMELAIEAPEIRFHEVSKSMGMELVEMLRTDMRVPSSLQ